MMELKREFGYGVLLSHSFIEFGNWATGEEQSSWKLEDLLGFICCVVLVFF